MDIRDMASDLTSRAGGAFSGLRDKLSGNSRNNDRNSGYDEYGYDEYGYDDDGVDGGYSPYDNPYDEYSYNYEEDSPDTRGAGRSSSRVSYPSLVTVDDIRANTQATERARREQSSAGARSTRSSNRVSVGYGDSVDDGFSSSPRTEAGRSRGYDSLFNSTSSTTVSSSTPIEEVSVSSRPAGYASTTKPVSAVSQVTAAKSAAAAAASASKTSASSYDPYAACQGSGISSYSSSRKLKVIAPSSYAEVESVSKALRAGDVAVLNLVDTDGDLSKRVLDFSFGVASALDARVDCVADKVFVIARGNALSDDEREKLKGQGVL